MPPPERAGRRKSSPELPTPPPAQTQKPPHLSQKIKRRTKLTEGPPVLAPPRAPTPKPVWRRPILL